MVTRDEVWRLLDLCYADIRYHQQRISTIQNWSLTAWLAILALVNTPQLQFSFQLRLVLPLVPVLAFWLLTAFEFMFIEFHAQRACEIESALAAGTETELPTDRVFLGLSYRPAYLQRLRLFLRALFLRESVILFFVLLTVATITLAYVASEEGGLPAQQYSR